MNKETSYSGFILTIMGSALLVFAATTLDPYKLDYTGIIAGAVLTAFGLSVALAGGIQPRFEHPTGDAYLRRRRLPMQRSQLHHLGLVRKLQGRHRNHLIDSLP